MVVFAQPVLPLFVAGGVLTLFGEAIRFWGVAYAGPLTRVTGGVGAPEVIVSGPFAYVRNPLYLGNILMYIGVGITANALSPWLVIVAAVYFAFQYSVIVSLEEEFLLKEFGEKYRLYKNAVPRFFPALKAFAHEAQQRQGPDWKGAAKSEYRTFQAILIVVAIIVVRWVWR